jgi:hypothetical protein
MRLIRFLLAVCFAAFGLLSVLMTILAFNGGDNFGTVFSGVLAVISLLIARRLVRRRGPVSWQEDPATDKQNWRDDPATDKQKSFADSLGIEYPKNISKGDLSDLISKVTGR